MNVISPLLIIGDDNNDDDTTNDTIIIPVVITYKDIIDIISIIINRTMQ